MSYQDKIKEHRRRMNLAKTISMLLNSLFFDRKYSKRSKAYSNIKNLDKIENLKIEDGNIFLADYKYGRVGINKLKSKGSIILIEKRLTRFFYFLCINSKYKMKYLKKNDFQFSKTKYDTNKEKVVLKSPFTILYGDNIDGTRLEYVSFYAVMELILLALKYYPMIALGIALQAFAGLRKGDVTNTSWNNINWKYFGRDLVKFRIDLRKKQQLRSDGINVGEIKTPGIAHVHPSFKQLFSLIFNEHQHYLRNTFKVKNKYGAIFINRDGKAMTDRSYEHAFNNLVVRLKTKLYQTGNSRAIGEANLMNDLNFTTHTLRFFFSQYISSLSGANIFEVAMFRRDRSLESAMRYIRENPYLIDDRIKKMQDKSMEDAGV